MTHLQIKKLSEVPNKSKRQNDKLHVATSLKLRHNRANKNVKKEILRVSECVDLLIHLLLCLHTHT